MSGAVTAVPGPGDGWPPGAERPARPHAQAARKFADSAGTAQVRRTSEEIICQVTDTGQITDPLAWHRAPSGELLGGNGLWLVNQVCDLIQARTSQAGTTARLHMRLNRP
jgi:hypothetical protein